MGVYLTGVHFTGVYPRRAFQLECVQQQRMSSAYLCLAYQAISMLQVICVRKNYSKVDGDYRGGEERTEGMLEALNRPTQIVSPDTSPLISTHVFRA
jgi:hypothetical protein